MRAEPNSTSASTPSASCSSRRGSPRKLPWLAAAKVTPGPAHVLVLAAGRGVDADRRRRDVGRELPGLAALAVGHDARHLVVELLRHVRRSRDAAARGRGSRRRSAGTRGPWSPPVGQHTNKRSFGSRGRGLTARPARRPRMRPRYRSWPELMRRAFETALLGRRHSWDWLPRVQLRGARADWSSSSPRFRLLSVTGRHGVSCTPAVDADGTARRSPSDSASGTSSAWTRMHSSSARARRSGCTRTRTASSSRAGAADHVREAERRVAARRLPAGHSGADRAERGTRRCRCRTPARWAGSSCRSGSPFRRCRTPAGPPDSTRSARVAARHVVGVVAHRRVQRATAAVAAVDAAHPAARLADGQHSTSAAGSGRVVVVVVEVMVVVVVTVEDGRARHVVPDDVEVDPLRRLR